MNFCCGGDDRAGIHNVELINDENDAGGRDDTLPKPEEDSLSMNTMNTPRVVITAKKQVRLTLVPLAVDMCIMGETCVW